MSQLSRHTKRALITLLGWSVLLLGIVMIPYPGPGWVVVFIGLSLLAREYSWAKDLHVYAEDKYMKWQRWLVRQKLYIKVLFWLLTGLTIAVTVWLLNGYGFINQLFDLGIDAARSPLPWFS